MSKRIQGKAVYKGTASGKIFVLKKQKMEVAENEAVTIEEEKNRLETAIKKSIEQLQKLYEKALVEAGEETAAIFEVHQMMLEDEDFIEAMNSAIEEQIKAEMAAQRVGNEYSEMFAAMDDDYMKARAADFKDISGRIIDNLQGKESSLEALSEPAIIVADDLTPSETVSMDKRNILAFVTVHGSTNSHTAILSRMMNIPTIIGADLNLEDLTTGMEAIVDGESECLILEPDAMEKEKALQKMEKEKERLRLLEALKGKENKTKGGRSIELFANIGAVEDIDYALENDAGGIGLFRSEFLYIGKDRLPTEEEQFTAYKKALESVGNRKVVIRTLDIGADKQADYLHLDKEENPALGYRAIRICLKQPDIFKTQLRALFRASVFGNLAIMYPMIISVEELEQIKKLSMEVKEELKAEGIPYKDVEEGIMIETPAAVMISDELAKIADFFSVGTNDLTQYTLAIDRQNSKLDDFYNPHHKAILKMIQMAAENIHKEGKWIGICGELGADLALTKTFLDMGIDELSVSPSMILKIREVILGLEE